MTTELDDLEEKVNLLTENLKLREELEKLQQEFDKESSGPLALFEKHKRFLDDLYQICKKDNGRGRLLDLSNPSATLEKYFAKLHSANQAILTPQKKEYLNDFLREVQVLHNYYIGEDQKYHAYYLLELEPCYGRIVGLSSGCFLGMVGSAVINDVYHIEINIFVGIALGVGWGVVVGACWDYGVTLLSDTYKKKKREYQDFKKLQNDQEHLRQMALIDRYTHGLTEIDLASQKS